MATTLQSADSTIAPHAQLDAVIHAAGFASLDSTGWIRVTGEDRVRWLNGMVTNAIQTLNPGEGCYNFVLNAQGRIQGDLTAFLRSDSILIETSRDQVPALLAHLDHFIIMDDVELADISDQRHGLLVAGPQAASVLKTIGFSAEESSTLKLQSAAWNNNAVDLIHAQSPIVPHFELWSDLNTAREILLTLINAGRAVISPATLEHLRILEGTPRYGTDIRNTATAHDLPQETAQTRALHFSKGCYLGQEIVERIHSRGNVHRTFTGFNLAGTLPEPGTILTAEGKPVGELTSVAAIPLASGPIQLALGYIRREAIEKKLPLEYPAGTATLTALPFALP